MPFKCCCVIIVRGDFMNPYVIIGIMIVIDLVTLPLIIRKMLKKEGKNKGVKIAALVAVFVIVEAVTSYFYIESTMFYDREGNQYKTAESVVYYDEQGPGYLLCETGTLRRKHFVSTDGKIMRIAERAYVDKDGYLVFDIKDEFKESAEKGVFTDDEGNKYYKAEAVEWNRKGEITLR